MTIDESALPGLLQQMVNDIEDPECSYWLYANHFDVLLPTQRAATRWWQAPLYINYEALWNPVFEENALLTDVILKNKLPVEHERIRIEYAQIWSLKRVHHGDQLTSADESILYHDPAKLKMPFTGNED